MAHAALYARYSSEGHPSVRARSPKLVHLLEG